ncbi:hypothetical protein RFI_02088 [Reticulomyxa filosa]|uniref:Uncharacterized protein n=1 Tax=Reticulomyxa filosa TaxID=46433 RepID=X6PBE7_RETFI|nr:hypothetical protein RFI_02088 [Reticulomyxa filosa]|eukprot:ETO34987.1 hypothetical protein RFI_02088 [Reticulomyxa filosa]
MNTPFQFSLEDDIQIIHFKLLHASGRHYPTKQNTTATFSEYHNRTSHHYITNQHINNYNSNHQHTNSESNTICSIRAHPITGSVKKKDGVTRYRVTICSICTAMKMLVEATIYAQAMELFALLVLWQVEKVIWLFSSRNSLLDHNTTSVDMLLSLFKTMNNMIEDSGGGRLVLAPVNVYKMIALLIVIMIMLFVWPALAQCFGCGTPLRYTMIGTWAQ